MTHTEHNWQSADGLNIYGQSWAPEGTAKAVICIVHGMGDHGGRYTHFVEYFVPKGYIIFAVDHRGHGKSEGQRGHMPNYEAMMSDMAYFLAEATKLFPNVPQFLFGHSMGGNVVTNYAIRRQPDIKGIIVSAPYFRLAFTPPAWKVSLGKTMAKIIPTLSQGSEIDSSAISRIPEEVAKYNADKLNHDRITAAFFVNIHPAGEWAIEHAAELTIPALVYHGSADKLTSYQGSEAFVKNSNGKAEFKGWEGYYHEMHNDIGKEQVLAYVEKWIEGKLNS